MQPTSAPDRPAAFNPLLGLGLVLANSLLLYYCLFYYEVSEDDKTLYLPLLVTAAVGQLLLVARSSPRPWRTWLWVATALLALLAGGLWLLLYWLVQFAHGFNH